MKKTIVILIFLIVCSTASFAQANNKTPKQIKRVLVFTFKPHIGTDSIKAVNDACVNLSKLPEMKSFDWGVMKSKNNDDPIKHVYVFGFLSEKDIEVYERSKEHDALIKAATIALQSFQVFDYLSDH
jgi:hypothetical protein